MEFPFSYNNLQGVIHHNVWSGKARLFVAGKEIIIQNKVWEVSGMKIEMKREKIILPRLKIDGQSVSLIHLSWWEWVFVLLPLGIILGGGAVPALMGFGGVYFNLSLFMNQRLNKIVKILGSLGCLLIAVVILIIVAGLINSAF